MRTVSAAVVCFVAMLAVVSCGHPAECLVEWYTWAESPGEVRGTYRGLELATVDSVDLQPNQSGDTGTLIVSGSGSAGDDDDSAGDDDDSAGEERDYEDLTEIVTWQIDVQWEDTFEAGARTEGEYALKPRGSDCATHGNKCAEAQISFNGRSERDFFRVGHLELFDPAEGLRGCAYLADTESEPEAEVDFYFTE